MVLWFQVCACIFKPAHVYSSVLCPTNILWSTESCARPKSKSPEVMEATHTAPIRYRWLSNMPLYQFEAQPLSLNATQRWVAGGLWSIHHGGFALMIFAQQPYIMIHFSMLAVGIFFFLPRSTQTSQHIVNRSTFYRPHPAVSNDSQQWILAIAKLNSRSISESDTLLKGGSLHQSSYIFRLFEVCKIKKYARKLERIEPYSNQL